MNSTKKATMSFSDGTPSIDLPIYEGTVGPDVVDIRKLYGQTGKFTFDPGFLSTASCDSKITYIDGDKGELLYRGYPIEQIAQNCDYLETCYLLLKGELPSRPELKDFSYNVVHHTHTRWPCWWVASVRCRPSITTRSTSITRSIGTFRRSD